MPESEMPESEEAPEQAPEQAPAEAPAETAVPQRCKTARTLGIISLVFSVLTVVSMVLFTTNSALFAMQIGIDPGLADKYIADNSLGDVVATLFAGTGVTDEEAAAALAALVAMFQGFGAIISIITVMSSVGLIRSTKVPEKRAISFVVGVIGGICALCTFRFVSAVLLFVGAACLRRQRIEEVGGIEAYYADGKKLGFMRVVEAFIMLTLVLTVAQLVFVARASSGEFHGEYWLSFILLLMQAVTLWIIWNRKDHGCQMICVMVAAYLVICLIYFVATGKFDPLTFLLNSIEPLFMFFYFLLSKRAHIVLSKEFELTTHHETLEDDERLWNPKSPIFWRNLVLYFCIFSVVGHWMEWGVCWLIRWGIVPGTYDPNSGIWHDMLNPFFVYGAAFVFIGLLLFPIKNWLQEKTPNTVIAVILSFVVNALVCGAIELAMGLVLNTPPDPVTGKLPLWDYSTMFCNFMGQICLLNTSFFGVMATIMTWLVYPNLETVFSKLPKDVMNIVTVVVVTFFALVVCMYVVNVNLPVSI